MPRYFVKGGVIEPLKKYDEWYEGLSFNRRQTSDDTFTPEKIYNTVLEYIDKKIIKLDNLEIDRPFYPGGDYQRDAETYTNKTVVIDNPPFSQSSEIIKFYTQKGIKFFLFTHGLTVYNHANKDVHLLCPFVPIEYDNGVKINTCFVHNLKPKGITLSPELKRMLLCDNNTKIRKKYEYPDEVLSMGKSVKLLGQLEEDHTIKKYYGVERLTYKGTTKRQKIFSKVLLLSPKEQATIKDKLKEQQQNSGKYFLDLSCQQRQKMEALDNKN